MHEDPHPQRPPAEEVALNARLERLAQRPGGRVEPGRPPSNPASKRVRRHPARIARYAAVGMSLLSTAGLTSLFVTDASGSTGAGPASIVSTGGSTPTTIATSTASDTTSRSATIVDGAVARNKWGNVQVEATFAADGTLTNVDAIQAPGGRGTSIEINDYAVPRLDAEAVDLQSAHIHTVSGATYTSDSYRSSLQSAIDAARAAGATTLV